MADSLDDVQVKNRQWWETTPMTYDWHGDSAATDLSDEWFRNQDLRSAEYHRIFATDALAFDRLIPFESLVGKDVLEIGIGSGFHAELLARAGAVVTGIDLTGHAVACTKQRFSLRQLSGHFEQWDAEQPRQDFERGFDFVWSWGVVHHSSRTARIVRNIHEWLKDEGAFAGMVYHRDSVKTAVALIVDGFLRAKLLTQSVDEILWMNSDGFSARFYPADQWQDLLLAFFENATVQIAGNESDIVPLPPRIRQHLIGRLPISAQRRILGRAGSFVVFNATTPLRR
jgi:2-polyprenyl-3-methyl-5-hydroxy-6-metoxy-1,4-benzoquinol methylase